MARSHCIRITALVATLSACSADSILPPPAFAPLTRAVRTAALAGGWQTRAPRSTPSGFGVAVMLNGTIYSFGGYHPHIGEQATLQLYDPVSDLWQQGPSPLTSRSSWAVAAANGKVYFFGGWDGGSETTFIEVFDLATQVWSIQGTIPRNHLQGAAAEIGGRIYIAAGGGNYSGLKAETEIYDPVTGTWTTGASIPNMRSAVAGAAVGGRLYVAGGLLVDGTRVATLDVYDPVTNTWATRTPMPTARAAATALAVDGKLWVAGGSTNNPDYAASLTDVVEIYDPATDTWATGVPMLTRRQAPQLARVGSAIHAIAGHGPTAGLTVHEVFVSDEGGGDPGPSNPASRDQCKAGGWVAFGFRNQGQCVRFVETGKDSR